MATVNWESNLASYIQRIRFVSSRPIDILEALLSQPKIIAKESKKSPKGKGIANKEEIVLDLDEEESDRSMGLKFDPELVLLKYIEPFVEKLINLNKFE